MSKLLDKLDRVSEGRPQPLGFGPAAAREKSAAMLMVGSLRTGDNELADVAAKGGVDAILFTVGDRKKGDAVGQLSAPGSGIPWGVSLDAVTKEDLATLIDKGCDFVVFGPTRTPASVLSEEGIGKVLQIDLSLDDRLARALNRLAIDAVLLAPTGREGSPLTVHQLMVYERLAGAAGKHLLAAVPPDFATEDLESLWGLGVRGLVVDLNVANPEQRLQEVQEAIRKLPATRKKSRERLTATVPLLSQTPEAIPPDEEEEDV